jgi:hypothetical protein
MNALMTEFIIKVCLPSVFGGCIMGAFWMIYIMKENKQIRKELEPYRIEEYNNSEIGTD